MCAGNARERKQRSRQPMDHPWSNAGVETTAQSWSWRACAVAALWCGLYVVVLLPALVVYTVVCTFLDAVAAVVSRTPAPASSAAAARIRVMGSSPSAAPIIAAVVGSTAWKMPAVVADVRATPVAKQS